MKKNSPIVILIVTLLAMVSGSVCMNKVSPVLTYIISDFSISNSTYAGLLISIFVISGIFLSIPMGMLLTKYGVFKMGLISLVCIIAGSVIGAVAGNYGIMLTSRVIEGIGLMFLTTLGPTVVASSFTDKNRGAALGLLMCFMSFGQIISYNLTPIMAEHGSWQNFWWISAVLGLVGLILWIVFIRKVDSGSGSAESEQPETHAGNSLRNVIGNKAVLLICITLAVYMLSHMGVLNYLPTYLTTVAGLNTAVAGSVTSLACMIGIPVGIVGGVLADKCGSVKKVLGGCMIFLAVSFGIIHFFHGTGFIIFAVIYGIASMAQAGLCFTAVASVVDVRDGGTASALLNTFQWTGSFFSAILFGKLLDSFGWNSTFYMMIPIALIGAVTILLNPKLK